MIQNQEARPQKDETYEGPILIRVDYNTTDSDGEVLVPKGATLEEVLR